MSKSMKCKYCFYEIQGQRHEELCPYNPVNTKKILIFLRDYVLKNSRFNKNFTPFPKPREFDEFCRRNKIARLQTIAHRYLSVGERINDWLVELLDYALFNDILTNEDFPIFVQYLYDSWIFLDRIKYQKLYQQSIIYEDGDTIGAEVQGRPRSETVKLLRSVGKPFIDEQEKLGVDRFVHGVLQ